MSDLFTTDEPEASAAMSCSPPFADRQKVDAKRYDASSPPWDKMGICIVIDQRKTRGCESGWMVKIMSKDGTVKELDSHWLSAANDPALRARSDS